MRPAKSARRRLWFVQAQAGSHAAGELHCQIDEPLENRLWMVGHLSGQFLNGQLFSQVVRRLGLTTHPLTGIDTFDLLRADGNAHRTCSKRGRWKTINT